MTINSPLSAERPRHSVAPLRDWAAQLVHRFRARFVHFLRSAPQVRLPAFLFPNGHASGAANNGGTDARLVSGYMFHSDYIAAAGTGIDFEVRLKGLTALAGELTLTINRLDNLGQPKVVKTKQWPLRRLATGGGRVDLAVSADPDYSYAIIGTLSSDADGHADDIEISASGAETDHALFSRLDVARRDFLSAPGSGTLSDIIVDKKATLAEPISQMCTAHQMQEPIFRELSDRLGQPNSLHRKHWEFAFILRALEYYGAVAPGHRGLGFGVGVEPMSSLFAAAGCHVLATDLPTEDDRARIWGDTAQLGGNLREMHYPALCSEADFFARVSYRPVDMNAIPTDLADFDFTWSSCAYEHLGSIEAGLQFFENSLRCLKKGGLAVHTTELNLSSNEGTLEGGATVLFRRSDFEILARRLIAAGHEVFPISFDSGDSELDRLIDLPPYSSD
ncbi:MAG: methyltransferase domain-containing protein, partial [Sphingomonas sp.]|nr:methyltransferase domain-containing protein [Sphingomonas sp.]